MAKENRDDMIQRLQQQLQHQANAFDSNHAQVVRRNAVQRSKMNDIVLDQQKLREELSDVVEKLNARTDALEEIVQELLSEIGQLGAEEVDE